MKPKTAYAQSGDVYIAHQVFGRGDVDLVVTASSNIDYGWEQPELASYLRALGSFARVILFDRRGTGLSDRTATVATIEERMDDIRAVMDAAESNRAALYAPWGLAAASVFFAATHPERVRALILWMPQIRRTWAPDYPWRTRQSGTQHPGATWGSDLDEHIRTVFPSRVGDEDFARWLRTALQATLSPSEVGRSNRLEKDPDARGVLPTIAAPTLVLHRGTYAPVERSAYVANRVPGGVLLDLGSGDSSPWTSDSETVLTAIRNFLAKAPDVEIEDTSGSRTVLATILFTDIVDSTRRAAELGDARWRDLLQRHHARVRRELVRFRGRELDTAGDGFFAMFDGPARAIRCARAIVGAGPELGLELRAGLHSGECELVDQKVAGIAVHIGARVARAALPGQVVVSSTVRDLVAGSGLEFEELGETEFKGVPGLRQVYGVSADSSAPPS